MFSLSFCSGTSQEETQMKGCDTRGGMVANVDVSTARQPISRGKKIYQDESQFNTPSVTFCFSDFDLARSLRKKRRLLNIVVLK